MSSASSCAWWIAALNPSTSDSKRSRSRSIWMRGNAAPSVRTDMVLADLLDGAGGQPSLEEALQTQVGDDLGDGGEHRGGEDLGLIVAELPDEELRHQGDGLHLGG